jgi:hypothetical protein
VRTRVRGTAVHVIEETEYPFKGSIHITVNPASPLRFPLQLRIPAWAEGVTISVNGVPEASSATGIASGFASVEHTWKAGDQVEIKFPMHPRVSRWFNDSIAVERGPLVFSYGIGESWVKLRDRGMTADWQVFPASSWNYAVEVDSKEPAKSFDVSEGELGDAPFARNQPPVRISAMARKVTEWRAEDGVANSLPQSPVASDQPLETITLIPYAAAKLRITAFPQCKDGLNKEG